MADRCCKHFDTCSAEILDSFALKNRASWASKSCSSGVDFGSIRIQEEAGLEERGWESGLDAVRLNNEHDSDFLVLKTIGERYGEQCAESGVQALNAIEDIMGPLRHLSASHNVGSKCRSWLHHGSLTIVTTARTHLGMNLWEFQEHMEPQLPFHVTRLPPVQCHRNQNPA